MTLDLTKFQDAELDSEYVTYLIDQQSAETSARYGRLWAYFRNPLIPAAASQVNTSSAHSRPYIQAQEVGLPARITGVVRHGTSGEATPDLRRKEVVIENDIAWRINTMVDFLFGRPVTVRSLASDPALAEIIERVIAAIIDANGGISFLQEISMLGCIYGFVDVALRAPAGPEAGHSPTAQRATRVPLPEPPQKSGSGRPGMPEKPGQQDPERARFRIHEERVLSAARSLQLETIEAHRVLPILEEDDFRRSRYWIQRFYKHPSRLASSKRPWYRLGGGQRTQAIVEVVEIIGKSWWQRYEDRQLIAEGPNVLVRIPVVHIQNIAMSGSYEGLSDVEPMVPLQDELNTRLSDRANRVTYQSFKMYLGKGIDDFLERPVGPGQMWSTQNPDASIEEFGTDSGSPSEDAHIEQIRQAMDKVSGVTPLAAGLIRGNVGHLTSATALKVLLSGLLSRTAKKRLTYGTGLQRIVELCLSWLNVTGVLKTAPEDRRIETHWPSPLPADEAEQLRNAQIKAQLGVPSDRILAELGYDHKTDGSSPND